MKLDCNHISIFILLLEKKDDRTQKCACICRTLSLSIYIKLITCEYFFICQINGECDEEDWRKVFVILLNKIEHRFFFIILRKQKNICTLIDCLSICFSILDAYATAKKLFERASYPVPNIEISSHNGKDMISSKLDK